MAALPAVGQTFVSLLLYGSILVIEMTGQTNGGNNQNINMALANDQMMVTSIGLFTSGVTVLLHSIFSLLGWHLCDDLCLLWKFSEYNQWVLPRQKESSVFIGTKCKVLIVSNTNLSKY